MQTRTIVYNARIETDIGVHAPLVSKIKMLSVLLVKQRLFSGLLLAHRKKSSFARFSERDSQKNWPISREFQRNFWGSLRQKTIGKKWLNFLATFH